MLLGALIALSGAVNPVAAQGSCQTNNTRDCQVGGTAALGMTLTVSTVVRLSIPSATFALQNATGAEFALGFATPLLVPLNMRANTSWTISLSATAALWTATGASPRLNKPQSDLQWGSAVGRVLQRIVLLSSMNRPAST